MNNAFEQDIRRGTGTSSSGSTRPQQTQSSLGNWLDEFEAEQKPISAPQPQPFADQLNSMPNSEKLSPVERWIYKKLPGFSESSIGKALINFGETPAGKVLAKLDVLAEGMERTLGLLAQYRDKDPDEQFRLKDAWAAGSLFYDTVRMPRVKYDKDGRAIGIQLDTDAPGAFAVTEARKLIEQGKTLPEVRDLLYSNMGALALRAQLKDSLGHIALDPLNFMLGAIKPVERLHAIRNLALTGKMDVSTVKALEAAARASGKLDDAAKFAEAIAKAEASGKALSRLDKFAIAMTGGTPYLRRTAEGALELRDVSTLTKGQKILSKINPFALTPQARASEVLDMVAANVGEYLVRPNWNKDPEEFLKALAGAARGSIGGEWGHLAMTTQGRTVQGFLAQSDGLAKSLGQEWKVYAQERSLLGRLAAGIPGMDERKIWQMAQTNPELLMKKIVAASTQPGMEGLAKELAEGTLTADTLANVAKIDKSIPLMREEFYVKALVGVQDVAMRQSILQFGITEKGLLTKWSDALKAWETLPFIKANPANAIRNVVNNDITLVGRGVFGTQTPAQLRKFWEGKYIPTQFQRGFGLAGNEIAGDVTGFDPGNAIKQLEEVLEGRGGLASKVRGAAESIDLKALDFSKISAKFERDSSLRAATNGWLQFHQQYWNPRTGFTSVSKHLDGATLDKMEEAIPGISEILDDVAEASGGDAQKFAELMQTNLEHNVATIFKNTSDRLGYKIEDVLGAELTHTLQSGLPEAIQKGQVQQFVDGVRAQMEAHVDDMFARHVENLPGIVAAQVQAGGHLQFHRIFGKAVDELWGGNIEHAQRMSSINDLMSYAKATGDYKKVGSLWRKIQSDGENHFRRIWSKFDAYQNGLKQGAANAGIKYPDEVANSFQGVQKGWREFFDFRNKAYEEVFSEGTFTKKTLESVQAEIDNRYAGIIKEEDKLFQQIDDLMSKQLADPVQRKMYRNYRDQAAELRIADKTKTAEFFKQVRHASQEEAPGMWQKYWNERMTRLEQMRQLDARGSAAIQGDEASTAAFFGQPDAGGEPTNIWELANRYGIASATKKGARNDRRVLNTVNKYRPEGVEKFKTVEDIPMDVAQGAFEAQKATKVKQATEASGFIPDAEKLFPDPMPIETGLSEMNYGRSYAAIDALVDETTMQASKKSRLLKELPEDIQAKVMQWGKQVEDESASFRAAGVQYAAFRRDSALLNYNRRTNFDSWLGTAVPFGFWTTHSVANWAIHSMDRPGMLTTYFRMRQLFETAGLPEQNMPKRLKGNIRLELPFVPDWMGETFVNPTRFLLPFDGFMMPWEQAAQSKTTVEHKTGETLGQMLEQGMISEAQYEEAIKSKSGDAWDMAMEQVKEGGDNYDAMDFVSMTMTPHAPLMWAYNGLRGEKQEIGAFTPMSRTVKNVATMMGVEDWSNSPYNIEGRIRKSLGLPAYDKWDDYRIGRSISNIAADGKYSIEKVQEAMEIAALVESGKMDSKDASAASEVYKEAVRRTNQEVAGGWWGTGLGILGIPIRAYPSGEQTQRDLARQFQVAYQKYDNGDVEALSNFFDEHPEYESRLALFKTPEERLKNFMVDHIWSKWNELPKIQQDEVKEQLGSNFETYFMNKSTRSYDSLTPLQLNVYLKLMGGKPIGTLSADQEVMIELNQLRLTEPETAWRVETFYSSRKEDFSNWSQLQNEYFKLPEGSVSRQKFVRNNPELQEYWDFRKKWMNKNPDLVRFLTDDEKQIAKYERMNRNPAVAVPTQQEIRSQMSPEMVELLQDSANGQELPPSLNNYMENLANQYGIGVRELMGIAAAP